MECPAPPFSMGPKACEVRLQGFRREPRAMACPNARLRPGSFLYRGGRARAGVLGWVGRDIAKTIYGRWRCERWCIPKGVFFGSWAPEGTKLGDNTPGEHCIPSASASVHHRLTARAVHGMVKRTAASAGVNAAISPHWLRHAHGSHAIDEGAPLHEVQATLGHTNISTTSGYLHARPGSSSGLKFDPGVFLQ